MAEDKKGSKQLAIKTVKEEVYDEFIWFTRSQIKVKCEKLNRKRYDCEFSARNRGLNIDAFGEAKVKIFAQGAVARLRDVECFRPLGPC
jgi:hypothetical protein